MKTPATSVKNNITINSDIEHINNKNQNMCVSSLSTLPSKHSKPGNSESVHSVPSRYQ